MVLLFGKSVFPSRIPFVVTVASSISIRALDVTPDAGINPCSAIWPEGLMHELLVRDEKFLGEEWAIGKNCSIN
jgi:hypothetical protein